MPRMSKAVRTFRPRVTSAITAATLIALAGVSGTALTTPAEAASSGAVINEVYGGGGNSGATLTNDFIELANAGSGAAALDGWSVQYISASPGATTSWQVTPLPGRSDDFTAWRCRKPDPVHVDRWSYRLRFRPRPRLVHRWVQQALGNAAVFIHLRCPEVSRSASLPSRRSPGR